MLKQIAVVFLLGFSSVLAANEEARFNEALNGWRMALQSQQGTIGGWLTEDFSAISPEGEVVDRRVLATAAGREGAGLVAGAGPVELKVRFYGAAAIVEGTKQIILEEEGTEFVRETRRSTGRTFLREVPVTVERTTRLHYTEFWVRQGGNWKIAHLQVSRG